MILQEQNRERLALFVVAQTIDALRQQKITETEAFEAVDWAVHAKATHDHAGLARRVEDMQRIHGIAPNLGGGAP